MRSTPRHRSDSCAPVAAAGRHEQLGRRLHRNLADVADEPDLPEDARALARRLRGSLFPVRPGARQRLAHRAAERIRLRRRLVEVGAALDRLAPFTPAPLRPRFEAWNTESCELDRLLGERTNLRLDRRARGEAFALRASTPGLIGRARVALADEQALDPDVPADLDVRVSGHVDALGGLPPSKRARRAQRVSTSRRRSW